MIYLGCDIEDNNRFKNKSAKFLKRIFSKNEISYALSFKDYESHLCARFCAKEAIIKAISNITSEFITYLDIEIIRNSNGSLKPVVKKLEKIECNLSVTISHEKDKSVAFAVIET